jgi:hypothetical protein
LALHRVEKAIATNSCRCCIAMARLSLYLLGVCPHTKDVDLLILIGYNLSNWTGLKSARFIEEACRSHHSSHKKNVHRARAASHRKRPACTKRSHSHTKSDRKERGE